MTASELPSAFARGYDDGVYCAVPCLRCLVDEAYRDGYAEGQGVAEALPILAEDMLKREAVRLRHAAYHRVFVVPKRGVRPFGFLPALS